MSVYLSACLVCKSGYAWVGMGDKENVHDCVLCFLTGGDDEQSKRNQHDSIRSGYLSQAKDFHIADYVATFEFFLLAVRFSNRNEYFIG